MRYEGGFQGRTNKLVDGCYSFWQGGALPLIHMVLAQGKEWSFSIKNFLNIKIQTRVEIKTVSSISVQFIC